MCSSDLRLRLALQRLDRQRGYRFAILGLGVDYASASHPDEATQFADLIARRTASCLRALDVPAHFDPKRLFIFQMIFSPSARSPFSP